LYLTGGFRIEREFNEAASSLFNGDVVKTGPGGLLYKAIYHVVLPVWEEDSEDQMKRLLSSSILNCLHEASKSGYTSIVFPPLGINCCSYPLDVSATVMVTTIIQFLKDNVETSVQNVLVCDRFGESSRYYQNELQAGDIIYVRKQGKYNVLTYLKYQGFRTKQVQCHCFFNSNMNECGCEQLRNKM